MAARLRQSTATTLGSRPAGVMVLLLMAILMTLLGGSTPTSVLAEAVDTDTDEVVVNVSNSPTATPTIGPSVTPTDPPAATATATATTTATTAPTVAITNLPKTGTQAGDRHGIGLDLVLAGTAMLALMAAGLALSTRRRSTRR